MATQRFYPGDKVKFTQKAKDLFDNKEYWHSANAPDVFDVLNENLVVRETNDNGWPSVKVEGLGFYIATYLLEPVDEPGDIVVQLASGLEVKTPARSYVVQSGTWNNMAVFPPSPEGYRAAEMLMNRLKGEARIQQFN